MSKRQFARKPRETAERNLRLVPPPKPKRRPKRRRWKIGRTRRPKYAHNFALHAYEETVVLATIGEMGGRASVRSITDKYPDRFLRPLLWKTLNRLARSGKLECDRRRGRYYLGGVFPGMEYYIPEEGDER